MSARRVLLIDSDPEFQQLLERQLGPHGFVILTPPDPSNPLGQVKELNPAVIFIAVELPDKIGYALCNKAKKGPASHVPVILVTSTVPASGFKSHRKLKVHADEYIDKRTMSDDEPLRAVDQLVGLGNYTGQPVDDLDVEELDVDDLDMALDEEAGAAHEFAADDDDQATPEPVPEPLRPSPRLATGGFEANAFGVDVDDLADEIDRAMDEVSGIREMPHVLFASSSGLAEPAGEDDVLSSADPLAREPEAADGGGEFGDSTAVASPPEPVPEPIETIPPPIAAALPPIAAALPPPDESERTTGDDLPPEPEAPAPSPVGALGSGPDLDLGLEEVASQAEEEKSGVHDRRYQVRVLQLEEEIARLRAQLDDARRQPVSGGGAFSREREFLNLREVINKKEKEILGLRESLAARDGEILTFRQTIRELRQERTDLDEKNVELEREMLNLRERMEELDSERAHMAEQKATSDRLLAALRGELARVNDELGGERAARREEAEALGREKARALDDLRAELEEERVHAARALEEKHARDLRTLKEAYEETARAREEDLARRVEEARAAADARREKELAELRARHDEVLARIESDKAAERAAAVAAVESRRESELAEAEKRRVADLAAAEERRAAAENALAEKFEGERAALAQEHREELSALDKRIAERDAEIATRDLTIRGLEADLADARESERGRVETIESLHRLLADRDQRISTLRAELAELERVNRGYQDQILRAHQKIRSDETTVDRAKKALAVALTLLDADAAPARPEAGGGNGR